MDADAIFSLISRNSKMGHLPPGFELAKTEVMQLELQNGPFLSIELKLEDDKTPGWRKLMRALDVGSLHFGKGVRAYDHRRHSRGQAGLGYAGAPHMGQLDVVGR